MKKNKMMRIASVLLIVTILSVCAISGTYAKYVTTGAGEGSARVAKWGINIAMTGNDLFAAEYDYTDPTAVHYPRTWDLAVKADEQVVAPGTSSEEAGGNYSAHISGTPEVAVKYALGFAQGWTDVALSEGDVIQDETVPATSYSVDANGVYTYEYEDIDVAYDYSPVKFSIVFKGSIAGSGYQEITIFDGISLTDADKLINGDAAFAAALDAISYNGVKAYVEDGMICFDCPAGKSIEGDFVASWAWDFDDNGAGTNDVYDTYLGNHVEDYPLSFAFVASATQID